MSTIDKLSTSTPMQIIGRIARTMVRIADSELKPFGLAPSQLPVLAALNEHSAQSQAELAKLAQVEQPSMAQLLNRMERDGLVQRVPDPADKRSKFIMLTPEIAACVPQILADMQGRSSRALVGFEPQEVQQLTELLLRLHQNIQAMVSELPSKADS